MARSTISLPPLPDIAPDRLGPFEFGLLGDRYVLSNDAGDWAVLSRDDFQRLLAGRIEEDHPRFAELHQKAFVRRELDLDALAQRIRRRKAFLGAGPHLHVVVTTLRCAQGCRYCHASRVPMGREGTEMSLSTAAAVVDHAMRSPSVQVIFEFQGGEPTANMPAIQAITALARERNRVEHKELEFSLVSNFTQMTEETAGWLVDNRFSVCTSLDGPRDLHDHNRPWLEATSPFDAVIHWMDRFNTLYAEAGLDPDLWRVDALLTVTRKTLDQARQIVDLYVERGLRSLHLRALNPAGFAKPNWERIGYTAAEFNAFRREALELILDHNLAGTHLQEALAAVVLSKMLTGEDPNYVDLRSPCGAGTGQLAYDHDGTLYPCDEARMLAATGDTTFSLGPVAGADPAETARHPTVKTLALASTTESLPGCNSCWNRPFCGVCPMITYMTSGDLFGQRPLSDWCARQADLTRWLLEKLDGDADGSIETIFRRWTQRRPRR